MRIRFSIVIATDGRLLWDSLHVELPRLRKADRLKTARKRDRRRERIKYLKACGPKKLGAGKV
jgi:hypothetical protein